MKRANLRGPGSIAWLWALLAPGLLLAAGAHGKGPALADLRLAALEASSPAAAGAAFERLWTGRTPAERAALRDDSAPGLALAARWLESRQVLDPAQGDLDPRPLEVFLKELERRLGAAPPAFWRQGLLRSRVQPGQHLFFPPPAEDGYQDTALGIRLQHGLALVDAGERLGLAGEGGEVSLARAAVTGGGSALPDQLGAAFAPGLALVAPHPSAGFPFTLLAADIASGELRWRAEVWAAGRTALGGQGYHRIELVALADRVLVFGLESHGAYAEAFELATGKPLARFCTGFWFHFPESWPGTR